MLNIKIQCCGMVILWLISYFYLRLPRMVVRTKKVFGVLMCVAHLCIVTDILSVIAIYYAEKLPNLLVAISCKVYLVFLLALIYVGFLYVGADIYKSSKKFKEQVFWYGIFWAAAVIAMCVLPIYYVCEDEGKSIYSYGPSTTVAYAFFAIAFISIVVRLRNNWKNIQQRRRIAVAIWLTLWCTAAIGQSLNNTLLIVSFAGCMGVLIIFTMIENPELSLDRASSHFHTSAMPQYLTELYEKGKPFSLICTHYYVAQREFYDQKTEAEIFVGGGEIFFLFQEREAAEAFLKRMSESFYKQNIYAVLDSGICADAGELLDLFKDVQRIWRAEQRSNVCMIDEAMIRKVAEREQTEQLILDALKEDRLEVFYQPIYSVKEKTFCSAEALVRIREKDGGIIPPGRFIPVAEENGTIIEIGTVMFEKVCDFLARNKGNLGNFKYIEVNLSVVQAEKRELAADVLRRMKQYGVAPGQINLEITESASIEGKELLLKTMEVLLQEGIEFSLDDFGTGQSNLDYMASMPVQLVKFDRSMTQGYFVSDKTRSIMDAAIRMIHDMGMKIVAEGIETKEQLTSMEVQGIEYIQGYYFSKPLPEAEFLEFLKRNS